jgi:hypothetical protein
MVAAPAPANENAGGAQPRVRRRAAAVGSDPAKQLVAGDGGDGGDDDDYADDGQDDNEADDAEHDDDSGGGGGGGTGAIGDGGDDDDDDCRLIVEQSEVVPGDVDRFLAVELNRLSTFDRERTMEEVHGVYSSAAAGGGGGGGGDLHDRGGAALRRALTEFEAEICRLSGPQQRGAYDEALRLDGRYVTDPSFRAQFVWAERFDVPRAVRRMMNFLSMARDVFGPDALVRPILWTDLSPGAKKFLTDGTSQILPSRDSAGRRVVVLHRTDPPMACPDRQQGSLYQWQSLAQDPESRHLGVVFVFFLHHASVSVSAVEEKRALDRFLQSMPGRKSAVHYCLPDHPLFHTIKAGDVLLIGKEERARLRLHVGESTVCRGGALHAHPSNADVELLTFSSFGLTPHFVVPIVVSF